MFFSKRQGKIDVNYCLYYMLHYTMLILTVRNLYGRHKRCWGPARQWRGKRAISFFGKDCRAIAAQAISGPNIWSMEPNQWKNNQIFWYYGVTASFITVRQHETWTGVLVHFIDIFQYTARHLQQRGNFSRPSRVEPMIWPRQGNGAIDCLLILNW